MSTSIFSKITKYIYVIIFGDKNSQDNLSKPGQEE